MKNTYDDKKNFEKLLIPDENFNSFFYYEIIGGQTSFPPNNNIRMMTQYTYPSLFVVSMDSSSDNQVNHLLICP